MSKGRRLKRGNSGWYERFSLMGVILHLLNNYLVMSGLSRVCTGQGATKIMGKLLCPHGALYSDEITHTHKSQQRVRVRVPQR